MEIRELAQPEKDEALKLVLNVFMIYEAPDYIEEGIRNFTNYIGNREYTDSLIMYGAYDSNKIVGVIATRNEGNHIALFFVDGRYHRQGIGKQLFKAVIENSTSDKITVNSSPYATEIYHHLGFADTNVEQLTDGMRYTPMVYTK